MVCGSRLRLVPPGGGLEIHRDYCSRHDSTCWARNDLRISKPQQPALPEQRDLFEGRAEIKLEIRPLRPAEMGSANVTGLAVAVFRSSRFINRVRP
jgi:hypothetical protein